MQPQFLSPQQLHDFERDGFLLIRNPVEVEVLPSADGEAFEALASVRSDVPTDEYGVIRRELSGEAGGREDAFVLMSMGRWT